MEESLSLLGAIRKKFVCDRVDIRTYSPLTLAFGGEPVSFCLIDKGLEIVARVRNTELNPEGEIF